MPITCFRVHRNQSGNIHEHANPATPVVFNPALLCDEQLYRVVIAAPGEAIVPDVLLSPQPRLEDSVADILKLAPARFSLVGTFYGGNLAITARAVQEVRAEVPKLSERAQARVSIGRLGDENGAI